MNGNEKKNYNFFIGLLIGALAPSLIAWGAMSARMDATCKELDKKVDIKVFEEYKRSAEKYFISMEHTLDRIESKLENHAEQ